jgi:DNA repair protein RecN (Recombination protein N)
MSLKRICLRDFVIVRELDLDIDNGFSVLTGETGAGKSILVDALQLVLGARADNSVIREGTQRCDLSAEFDSPAHLSDWLDEAGFDAGESLLLRRVIDTQGKSRAWINGSAATATQLRELGDALVDIHGQHAWQSLTRPDSVRGLLDAYAGTSTDALQGLWATWRAAQRDLDAALQSQDRLQQERERLSWQIGEVDKLSPGLDEWDELNAQHTRLSHARALIETAESALSHLQDDQSGVLRELNRVVSQLQEHTTIEPAFTPVVDVLASSLAQAEDAVHSLQSWLRRTDLDPERLSALDERMSQWMGLARRFKRPPADLATLWDGWKQELTRLDHSADLDGLRQRVQAAETAYQTQARQLSQARQQAAPQLAQSITQAMQGLGMNGGRFDVQLDACEPSASGMETVQFLVAGHSGSSPRPMGKVASGGELSRIALAIAVTTSRLGTAQTLIFDEVDAGVGGAVADTVGRLMKQLGRDRQVLAVTHLPQVASCADHHLLVAKHDDGHGTSSQVQPIEGEARVAEIARMLSGERRSDTTLAHAREMLEEAAPLASTPVATPREPSPSRPARTRSSGAVRS